MSLAKARNVCGDSNLGAGFQISMSSPISGPRTPDGRLFLACGRWHQLRGVYKRNTRGSGTGLKEVSRVSIHPPSVQSDTRLMFIDDYPEAA